MSKPQSKSQQDNTINSELDGIFQVFEAYKGRDYGSMTEYRITKVRLNYAKSALQHLIAQEANKARLDELESLRFQQDGHNHNKHELFSICPLCDRIAQLTAEKGQDEAKLKTDGNTNYDFGKHGPINPPIIANPLPDINKLDDVEVITRWGKHLKTFEEISVDGGETWWTKAQFAHLQKLLLEARIDELKKLPNHSAINLYVRDRITTLKSKLEDK